MTFENLEGKMGTALYALCMFTTFMFLATSAPISQFKGKGLAKNGASKTSCITAWGTKSDCDANNYDTRPSGFRCDKSAQLFQATEAFYIISVLVSLLACVLSFLSFKGRPVKVVLGILGISNIAFALIPWALMTAVWHKTYCHQSDSLIDLATGETVMMPTGELLQTFYKTSAGYGLTIAGWCINVIGVMLLFVV